MTATTESVHATIWTARHRSESSGVLLRIQDVPGKNRGPDTGYDKCCFPWFSSVPQGKCQDNTSNNGTPVTFHNLCN
jgi:hypothetical protein